MARRRHFLEHVVQLVGYRGSEWVGSIDLEQPWEAGGLQLRRRGSVKCGNVKLGGQRITWGNRFRSLRELREWYTFHGADRVHLVYETCIVKSSNATNAG